MQALSCTVSAYLRRPRKGKPRSAELRTYAPQTRVSIALQAVDRLATRRPGDSAAHTRQACLDRLSPGAGAVRRSGEDRATIKGKLQTARSERVRCSLGAIAGPLGPGHPSSKLVPCPTGCTGKTTHKRAVIRKRHGQEQQDAADRFHDGSGNRKPGPGT